MTALEIIEKTRVAELVRAAQAGDRAAFGELFARYERHVFAVALRRGEDFSRLTWFGLALAFGGLVYLVSPGVTAPPFFGAALMAVAGLAWGFYSLLGKDARNPLSSTAANFVLGIPAVLVLSAAFLRDIQASPQGVMLAVLSGAVASGLGYVTWYAALRGLTATRAASVQLSVPVIAALGGVVLLAEPVTARLVLASIATLGGVALVLLQRSR